MKPFAQLLASHIASTGIKQTHLAATAHISYNYLQRLLAGDRHPSDQVVYHLAQALRLSPEQTGTLLAAAGHAPSQAFLQATLDAERDGIPFSAQDAHPVTRLIHRFYRLAQRVPQSRAEAFFEEMQHFLGYAHYKYLLCGGANLLDLAPGQETVALATPTHEAEMPPEGPPQLDVIAQLVGELHHAPEPASVTGEESSRSAQAMEQVLTAIDHFLGMVLSGEVAPLTYRPDIAQQVIDMVQAGAPWEIRRRIAEALPGLCRLDVEGACRLIEILRTDTDEIRGVDIRRRVLEALPALVEAAPVTLPTVLPLLQAQTGDDQYVALTTVEVCGDIQAILSAQGEADQASVPTAGLSVSQLAQSRAALSRLVQQLAHADHVEQESLRFSLAVRELLAAPDTALVSLREGIQSPEKLIQWVAVRYLERLLPTRPYEVLELYQFALHTTAYRNVRRTVAKAFPSLLRCLNETALTVRTLARAVIVDLATDPDVYVRRAVADHAMHLLSIDREFLLTILRLMVKDSDQAIRSRLQPVALRLAQVWLIWYAETAGLVDTHSPRDKARTLFGE